MLNTDQQVELRCAVEHLRDQILHMIEHHGDNSPEFRSQWADDFLRTELTRYFANVAAAERAEIARTRDLAVADVVVGVACPECEASAP